MLHSILRLSSDRDVPVLYRSARNTSEEPNRLAALSGQQGTLQFLTLTVIACGCLALSGCSGTVVKGAASNPESSAGTLSASPVTVNFGSVSTGASATNQITVVNSSTAPVVISQLGLSVSSFSVDGQTQLPLVLAAGTSLNLNAHFTPTAPGSISGQLTITNSSTADPTLTIQLIGVGTSSASSLGVSSSSIAFGSVSLDSLSTQSLTLSSSGSSAVTVNAATVTGTGFSVSGATFPFTLPPGQTATLSVQFDPTSAGAATGQLAIASNSSSNGTEVVALSGTGAPHAVDLSWEAPSSSADPIAGYRIYRSTGGSSSYQLLNSSVDTQTAFTDSSVQVGLNYNYYVTSVADSGEESTPSNTTSVAVD